MKTTTLIGVWLCMATIGCHRESITPDALSLLTGKKWIFVQEQDVNPDGSLKLRFADPCRLDDVYTFNANNSFEANDSIVKCDYSPSGGNWDWTDSLSDNDFNMRTLHVKAVSTTTLTTTAYFSGRPKSQVTFSAHPK